MKRLSTLCVWTILLGLCVGVMTASPRAGFAQQPLIEPLDRATPFAAGYFECNGTWQERYGVYWLASPNVFKFRRHYTATWYFENLSTEDLLGDVFILKLVFAVYTNSIESGGKPTAATVDLIVQNPDDERTFEALNVRVEMNKDATPIPTYVCVPREFMTDDGRTVVELHGIGQIGVSPERMRLLFPFDVD